METLDGLGAKIEVVMNSEYRKQISRIAEYAFSDYERHSVSRSRLINELISLNTTKFERAKAAFLLLREMIPASWVKRRKIEGFPKRATSLPLSSEFEITEQRIGVGSFHDVFLLNRKDFSKPSFCLKFDVLSELDLADLQTIAKKRSEDLEVAKRIYANSSVIFPRQIIFLGESLQGSSKPSIVTLQEYLGTIIADLFQLPKKRIIEMCHQDYDFRSSLLSFIEKTLRHQRTAYEAVDIGGRNNVSVVRTEQGPRLLLLETDFRHLGSDRGRKLLLKKLGYLRNIRSTILKESFPSIQKSKLELFDRYLRNKESIFAKLFELVSRKRGKDYLDSRLKKVLDSSLSIPAAVLAIPPIVILGLAKKIEDGGTAFFIQERLLQQPIPGFEKRTFSLAKIRTMVSGAEREGLEPGRGKSEEQDPRSTPFGSLLRKYKLDELPQLVHVVLNQMSLIGPRPQLTESFKYLRSRWSDKRFLRYVLIYNGLKKGITGLAQAFDSNKKHTEKNFHYDVFYSRNASLGLDLYILFRTLLVLTRLINNSVSKEKRDKV